jgi:hypothetical protein
MRFCWRTARIPNSWNVDQTDTTDLHVMALHLVSTADQHVVAALADDHEIVGHQAVSPLDQIENAFRFTNSAHAREKETHTENVGERAMKRGGGGELHLQDRLDPTVELRGLELGAYQWNSGGACYLLEASG